MKLFKRSASAERKTIRLDKKVFFVMMLVTPIFAAYAAVLTLVAIMQPWKDNSPLQVPVLGGVIEEETEEKAEEKPEEVAEEKEEEKPVEEEKKEEPAQAPQNNIVSKSINFIQNRATTTTNTQKQTATPVKNETKAPEQTETKQAEKTETKAEEKPVETKPSEAELCAARTDGPKTYIRVRYLTSEGLDPIMALFSGKENPVVDYFEATAPSGHATMVWNGSACVPSTDGLTVVEDSILDESELESHNITTKSNYEVWL